MSETAAHAGQLPNLIDHFREVLLLLALAGVAVPVFERLRIPPIIGYLICGIAAGPFGFGQMDMGHPWLSHFVVRDMNMVGLFGELGVVFLLFTIGLELSVKRLWDMRRLVLGLGSLQIGISAVVIAIIAAQFGNSREVALLLGASLALSSTAMVTQLLKDQHRLATPIGRLSFSVLLMQDLAVVPLLVLTPLLASPGEQSLLYELGRAFLTATIAIAVIFALGHWVLKPLFTFLGAARKPEYFFALVLLVVIGSAALTAGVGLSAAFGAFLAGLLIAETEFRHEVEILIEPLKGLLLGVFFLSVGMQTDVLAFAAYPVAIVGSVVGLLAIKASLLFLLIRLFGVPIAKAAEAALLLGGAGEFALLILAVAGPLRLISAETEQFFLLVTTLSMMVTPLVAIGAKRLGRRLQMIGGTLPDWLGGGAEARPENHIIIAGFGRVGVTLAAILEQEGFRYVAVDLDPAKIRAFRQMGHPVYYGDARRVELWRRLSADRAAAVLITIDDHKAADEMLRTVRAEWPLLPVVIRAREVQHMARLYADGATKVVPEMLESSLQIAEHLLRTLGKSAGDVEIAVDSYRSRELDARR